MSAIHEVNFSAVEMQQTQLLWADESLTQAYNREQIRQMFSLQVAQSEPEYKQIMTAECYGGIGVGDNGGGVRCGNIHGYQIKGIGQNLLVGKAEDLWHSYGGLSAVDAIYEAIYSRVLNQYMPLGAAKIHAVLLTEPDAAYEPGCRDTEKGWGALMVREICTRPAHYLRAPLYQPRGEYRSQLLTDVARTRRVNKQLKNKFASTNDFIKYFGSFLMNSANQFAFARIARIFHGSISPSNICYDGRWLDLTNTTFVKTNENTAGYLRHLPSFYEEPQMVFRITHEVIATYLKYNQIPLNPTPLLNYYQEQLQAFQYHHYSFIFGLESGAFSGLKELVDFTALYQPYQIISNNFNTRLNRWPDTFNPQDSTLLLIEAAFLALTNTDSLLNQSKQILIEKLTCSEQISQDFLSAFKQAMYQLFLQSGDTHYAHFCQQILITALKRLIIPAYFYKGRLEPKTKDLLASNQIANVARFIEESMTITNWAFSSAEHDNVIIFQSTLCELTWDKTQHFILYKTQQEEQTFSSFKACHHFIQTQKTEIWQIQDFDFSFYLNTLFELLVVLEDNTQ